MANQQSEIEGQIKECDVAIIGGGVSGAPLGSYGKQTLARSC